MSATIDILAARLPEEIDRQKRKRTSAEWYRRYKRTQRKRYARAKAKREPVGKAGNAPWNKGSPEKLYICDSVKRFLYGEAAA
jgi:hypothetical protein